VTASLAGITDWECGALIIVISQSIFTSGRGRSGVPNDHTETAYATAQAMGMASLPKMGSGQAPHNVAVTLYPGVYFNKDEWDFIIDICQGRIESVPAGRSKTVPRDAAA
jgi:hypothetical protein